MASSSQIPHGTLTAAHADDDARWQAIVHRDPAADDQFYYSVKTTGIYCRPACRSRQPLRKNVTFHLTCAQAELAGFRPCKRCQPTRTTLHAAHSAFITAACRHIEEADIEPSLTTLARQAGMSASHFHRLFVKAIGLTPKAYAQAQRAERVRRRLTPRNTVTAAVYGAGFNSNGRFYATSARMLGMTPSTYRNGGVGEVLRFAVGTCSLGAVLVASSEKGVCAILLGDDADVLAADLRHRFPRANLVDGDPSYAQVIAQVIGVVDDPKLGLDLPLDVRGTAFQQKVWQMLTTIPPGMTANYAKIAERIGSPKAVRAVAGACAANALAVVIPCHRVLRADGELAGYRWGVERKRALLQYEEREEREGGLPQGKGTNR